MSALKSKYLNVSLLSKREEEEDVLEEQSEDEVTSDSEFGAKPGRMLFTIDSKASRVPDEEETENKRMNSRREESQPQPQPQVRIGSSLKPGISIVGYLGEKPAETMRLLQEMTLGEAAGDLLQKTVIKPGFEQQFSIKGLKESKRQRKKRNKAETEKSAGKGWFNLPASELTEEKKRDLMVLQMRSALDPKRFYKRNDVKTLPKYFQMGTVVETSADFNSRLSKKERKNTLVEELLADAEFRKWNKRKYAEALQQNPYYLRKTRRKEAKAADKLKEKGRERHRKQEQGSKSRGRDDKGAKRHAKKLKRHK